MTLVLRQRRWRLTLSLLAMIAWVLGTNFCALGLMARPCVVAAPTVSECPHCPAKPSSIPAAAPCCQKVQAELPPSVATALPPLLPVPLCPDWANVFCPAPMSSVASEDSSDRAFPDTGPPAGQTAMRVLLGRCAPVHAPPVQG